MAIHALTCIYHALGGRDCDSVTGGSGVDMLVDHGIVRRLVVAYWRLQQLNTAFDRERLLLLQGTATPTSARNSAAAATYTLHRLQPQACNRSRHPEIWVRESSSSVETVDRAVARDWGVGLTKRQGESYRLSQ